MMEKARELACDAVVFDLEDAVASDEKNAARTLLAEFLTAGFKKPYFVRINALGTEYFESDLQALPRFNPRGIILPKATKEAVAATSELLHSIEGISMEIGIIPLIESALAVETILAILDASPRVMAAQLGAEDLTADLGIPRTAHGEEINYARHRIVYGCRAKGLPAYDTPFLYFKNEEGLTFDSRTAKAIGFMGKTCIHPGQIPIINQSFAPTEEEIAAARAITAAAGTTSGGAFSLHGKMIDGPVIDRARQILARQ